MLPYSFHEERPQSLKRPMTNNMYYLREQPRYTVDNLVRRREERTAPR